MRVSSLVMMPASVIFVSVSPAILGWEGPVLRELYAIAAVCNFLSALRTRLPVFKLQDKVFKALQVL